MTATSKGGRPPGPAGLPIIGSAFDSRRALEFLLENRRDYGDMVYYEFLKESIYQLNRGSYLPNICQNCHAEYRARDYHRRITKWLAR